MPGQGRDRRSGEPRKALAELDAALRGRLLRLDEPVDRSDWEAVVRRSRRFRLSSHRSLAVVASGAAVLSLALILGSARRFPGAGHPRAGAAPFRLALRLGDGRGLVLYFVPSRARFLDNPPEGATVPTAAIERSLSGGPFRVRPAALHGAARTVADAPLPGDQALVSFHLFRTAGLRTTAGSAVLTCEYGVDRNAYCDGAVDLENGVRLTASGTLTADASHVMLVVTGGYGREGVAREPRREPRPGPAGRGLERSAAPRAIKVLAFSRHSRV